MYPALATRGACVPRSGEAPAPPPPTAHAVLTGAADHETGMLAGLNTSGHEIGGLLGIATIAAGAAAAGLADGIGDAFLPAALIAGAEQSPHAGDQDVRSGASRVPGPGRRATEPLRPREPGQVRRRPGGVGFLQSWMRQSRRSRLPALKSASSGRPSAHVRLGQEDVGLGAVRQPALAC
jgi:hypothetical protein